MSLKLANEPNIGSNISFDTERWIIAADIL